MSAAGARRPRLAEALLEEVAARPPPPPLSAVRQRSPPTARASPPPSLSPPAASAASWEPVCQVTFGRRVCMRGSETVECPANVDKDRKDGAVPTESGAWKIEAANYTYFMDRGLVAALAP